MGLRLVRVRNKVQRTETNKKGKPKTVIVDGPARLVLLGDDGKPLPAQLEASVVFGPDGVPTVKAWFKGDDLKVDL